MMNRKTDINQLTIEEKIGQLFMYGIHGLDVTDETIELIKTYKVGNIILFTRNIDSSKQVYQLTQSLQKLAYEHLQIPLLISIDQEGGMVTRIKNDDLYFPGAMTLSAYDDEKATYQAGYDMGLLLKTLGINMNLAPVLDVNHNPKNPVIGVRSYGDQAQQVSKHGLAFFKGLEEHVLATGKHFPGHGNTHVDSHLGLPTVDATIEELKSLDLIPFVDAINQDISALMTAHIHFPKIEDKGLPATLSKKILTDLLRNELNFKGLIVTDGMQMDAISKIYGTVKGCELSIFAGADMSLICHSHELQIKTINHFKSLYQQGILTDELLNDRVSRILTYKERLDQDIDLTQSFEEAYDMLPIADMIERNYHVVEQAATHILGKTYKPYGKTLYVGIIPSMTSIADESQEAINIENEIKHSMNNIATIMIPVMPKYHDVKAVLAKARQVDQVVINTYNGNIYHEQIKLIEALAQEIDELYVVAMRNPYDLNFTDKIKNYTCLYEYTPHAIKVLIKYLKGELICRGKVPITL